MLFPAILEAIQDSWLSSELGRGLWPFTTNASHAELRKQRTSLTGKPSSENLRVIYSSCLFLSNITKITILKTPEGNKSFRQLLDTTSQNLLGEPPVRRNRGPDFWISQKGSVASESTNAHSSGAFWSHRSRCTSLSAFTQTVQAHRST